jgi:hypothetical protein
VQPGNGDGGLRDAPPPPSGDGSVTDGGGGGGGDGMTTAPIAFVQAWTGSFDAGATSAQVGTPGIQAGHVVVVAVDFDMISATPVAAMVKDSMGNTFLPLISTNTMQPSYQGLFLGKTVSNGGTPGLTVGLTNPSKSYLHVRVLEYSGVSMTMPDGPKDAVSGFTPATSKITSPPVAVGPGDLVVGFATCDCQVSASGAADQRTLNANSIVEDVSPKVAGSVFLSATPSMPSKPFAFSVAVLKPGP